MHHDQFVPAQANTDQTIQDFLNELENIKVPKIRPAPARTSSACPSRMWNRQFIPECDLEDYLTVDKIQSLLRAIHGKSTHLPVAAETVQGKCCKVFAILVLIGRGGYIKYFVDNGLWDSRLPFSDDRPKKFPKFTHPSEDFWTRFQDIQWQFCAHKFARDLVNHHLDENVILPIVDCEKLVDNTDSGTVFKIRLHPDYHDFYDGESTSTDEISSDRDTFVIKSFGGSDSKRLAYYHSEVYALKHLKCNTLDAPAQIVGCYGSFIQNNNHNIILEFADKGNLEEYFRNTSPPEEPDEFISFWKSMKGIAKGLVRIHGINYLSDTRDMTATFHGYHQDLKPANILVFSRGATSPYQYTFKIADLGLSHFIQVRYPVSSVFGPGEQATRTYGAPEIYRAREINPHEMNVPQKSDVWSLACICSVAACWAVGGQTRIDKFTRVRQEARRRLELTPSDCFHDDMKVLPEVQQSHTNDLVDASRRTDRITELLWSNFLNEAFSENVEVRLWAEQVHHRMEELLKRATASRQGRMHSTVDSPPHTPTGSTWRTSASRSLHEDVHVVPGTDLPRDFRENDRSTRRQISGYPAEMSPPLTDPQGSKSFHLPRSRGSWNGLEERLSNGRASTLAGSRSRYKGLNIRSSLDQVPDLGDTISEGPVELEGGDPNTAEEDVPVALTKAKAPPRSGPASTSVDKSKSNQKCCRHQPGFMSVEQLFNWFDKKAMVPHSDFSGALSNRDHVFLIDNSESMKPHWPQLVKLFGALAKFVKIYDQDGIEVFFTHNTQQKMQRKDTTDLIAKVKSLQGSLNAPSDPDGALRAIFNRERRKTLRDGKTKNFFKKVDAPLTVYFFTDAVWQDATDLWPVIGEIVNLLEEKPKKPPKHVGLQFIQFGKDPRCTGRLKAYDDPEAYGLPKLARDIIDHEPCDKNVWKMLLGSVNSSFDQAECDCGLDA